MQALTDKDIGAIKNKFIYLITIIHLNGFDWDRWIGLGFICVKPKQRDDIERVVRAEYPNIKLYPISEELKPLIAIAKRMIVDERKTKAERYDDYFLRQRLRDQEDPLLRRSYLSDEYRFE